MIDNKRRIENLQCCGNCIFNDNCHRLDEIYYICKNWKYDGLEKYQRLLEEAQDERQSKQKL